MTRWLLVLLLGACTGEGVMPASTAPAEVMCPLPENAAWKCIDKTADCIAPDGTRQTLWERPIYCCDGVLVAPPLDADSADPCGGK